MGEAESAAWLPFLGELSSECETERFYKIHNSDKSYLKRKRMSKLHKIFESFLADENTKENLPKRSLQSVFFAVNCTCKTHAAPQTGGVRREQSSREQ